MEIFIIKMENLYCQASFNMIQYNRLKNKKKGEYDYILKVIYRTKKK